jgi:hypothetical protein
MKYIFAAITIILLIGTATNAEKIAGFVPEEIFKSPMLRMDDEFIYIIDQALVKGIIYERNTLKKYAEFLKRGQGPGELTEISNIAIDDRYIYVSSFPKLCIFSQKGKLVKELRGPYKTSSYIPFGDNFIGTYQLPARPDSDIVKLQFNLYDCNLKKKKELFLTEFPAYVIFKGDKKYYPIYQDYAASFVYKDALYIGSTEKGFFFSVFNMDGEKMYDITRDIERVKVKAEKRRKILNYMRESMGENKWQDFKAKYEVIFPDYYPVFKDFFVSDDKIWVFMYPLDGKYEIMILDLKGNLLKSKYYPIMELGLVHSKYHCIFKGNLYQVRDNNDNWELHRFNISE